MTCSACSAHVEKSVGKLDGVSEVRVNLLSNSMTVDYDEHVLDAQGVCTAVEKAGYGASPADAAPAAQANTSAPLTRPPDQIGPQLKEMKFRLVVSFCFLIPLFYISMGHMMGLPLPHWMHGTKNAITYAFTQFLLCLPILYVNRKYFQVGFRTLFHGAPNMDSLIAIGATAAMAYGAAVIFLLGWGLGHGDMKLVEDYSMELYFESAAMILSLITLGKFLETRSKGKTGEAIAKLMDLAPKTALVERDGVETEIPVEQVNVGDIVIVKPGQSVPVDGQVISGVSAVDESAITGESIPVEKAPGDTVISATINKSGALRFQATKVGADTTLRQIITLVEEAANSKAPISKLADKVSGIFVPVVITIAVVATIVWLLLGHTVGFALSIGIAVLVISCPCALGLATPVAIMVGTGVGAENGILVKSAQALETAHQINTVVLDKTGTITQGKPKVTDIVIASKLDMQRNRLLTIAASLEKSSEHPLAEAVVEEAAKCGLDLLTPEYFQALPGKGLEGTLDGVRYFAGNERLMEEKGIKLGTLKKTGDDLSEEGKTPLYFADEKQVLGIIAAADVIKPTSKHAVELMQKMGLEVVMLTGDNERTARAIQKQVGVEKVVAQVLPQDKQREVAALQAQGRKVAMVGDGINDAPALTKADVGIAIGAGADVAIESADIVLMKSDLLDAVTAIDLSRAVIRNIKQNLFWAFFYNSIGIPLAAGVFFPLFALKLNPMFGAAAMSLSSVCVVSNALRLKFFKPHKASAAREAISGDSNLQLDKEPQADAQASENIKQQNDEKGEITMMEKRMVIEGMSCGHCSARVEKALNALDGVENAKVDLEAKTAFIQLAKEVADDALRAAVTDAGYDVVSVENA